MRLPFPERIPFRALFIFAAALCAVQMLEGTNSTFSICSFLFILVAGVAFNVAGGFSRPSGAYIFFFSTLGVILGLFWKAYLGEAADSNLQSPLLTMYVYLASISLMLVAVYLSRQVTLKRPLLGDILPDYKMQTATVGCTIFSFGIVVFELLTPGGNGSVLSALNQINHFFHLAVIIGVIHTIRQSGGRRSVNGPVLVCLVFMFFDGVIGFSKEGMFGGVAAYMLAACSQRYRVSRLQIGMGILVAFIAFHYLVPFSQYGRIFKQESISENVKTAFSMMANLGEVREQYLATTADTYEEELYEYFDTPQGFFERLQMISIDDSLIDHTEKFGTFGLSPVIVSLDNMVPHFIWKDKPAMLAGNVFAHEVGVLGPEDDSTGVSFSAAASAFHIAGWIGTFSILPITSFLLFWVYDSLCGDVRKTPWGLIVMVIFTHAAPEGDTTTVIYLFSTGAIGVIVCSLLAAYLMPIIGSLFIGPERVFLKRGARIQTIPRRLLPVAPSES